MTALVQPLSSPGRYAAVLEALPADAGELVRIVQGLCIYDVVAHDFYGVELSQRRQHEIHLRSAEAMLERIFALDARPLAQARPPAKRLAARCGQYTMLLVAMLRAKGIRARARCGFGAYFNAPYFEDHWVAEYRNAAEERWALADAQFDEVWRKNLNIRHDVLDVPHEQFLVGAEAWRRCRSGEADPDKFGIAFVNLRGLWFIAGSLIRDTAALNGVQMRPWDVWGAMPQPGWQPGKDELAFLDRLAGLTLHPDANFQELKALYQRDERLRVPPTVFNALLNRPEPVLS